MRIFAYLHAARAPAGTGKWLKNQNGPGYSCHSCYCNFGAGKLVESAADPKQLAITQFFKKQKQ